jgi:hypothetical protein
MARPSEKRRNITFPLIVMLREIAKETILAKSNVNPTEKTETNTEFLNGVHICPSAKSVRKLLRLKDCGSDSGFV